MKQPLILTAEQRRTCALAIIARDPAIASMHASVDERTIAWAIGLVRRAETYLAVVHAHAIVLWKLRRPRYLQHVTLKRPRLHSEAIALAIQGHELLLALIKAAGWPRTAAQILADVAFGVSPEDAQLALNLGLPPASE